MNRSAFSPLLVWKLILPIVLFAIGLSFLFNPWEISRAPRIRALSQRIDTIHLERDDHTVVFLGNSLLRRSLPANEKEMGDALSREHVRYSHSLNSITVYYLTLKGGSARDIRYFAERVIVLKPTVMVLQVDI
jgi:hypothetical protein